MEEHGAEVLRAHSQGGKGSDMGRKWTPPAGAGKRWRSHTMTIHSNSSEDFNGAAANRVEKGPAACGDDNITGGVNADQIATSHWDSNAGQNRLEEPGRSVAAASVVAPPWGMEASRLLHVGGIPEGAKRAVCGALEQWLVELVCECGERLPHSGDRIVSNTEHLADQPGQLVVRLKSPELLTLCLEKAKGRRIGGVRCAAEPGELEWEQILGRGAGEPWGGLGPRLGRGKAETPERGGWGTFESTCRTFRWCICGCKEAGGSEACESGEKGQSPRNREVWAVGRAGAIRRCGTNLGR